MAADRTNAVGRSAAGGLTSRRRRGILLAMGKIQEGRGARAGFPAGRGDRRDARARCPRRGRAIRASACRAPMRREGLRDTGGRVRAARAPDGRGARAAERPLVAARARVRAFLTPVAALGRGRGPRGGAPRARDRDRPRPAPARARRDTGRVPRRAARGSLVAGRGGLGRRARSCPRGGAAAARRELPRPLDRRRRPAARVFLQPRLAEGQGRRGAIASS